MRRLQMGLAVGLLLGSLAMAIIGPQVWGQPQLPASTPPAAKAAPVPPPLPPRLDPAKVTSKPSGILDDPATADGDVSPLPPPLIVPARNPGPPPKIEFLPGPPDDAPAKGPAQKISEPVETPPMSVQTVPGPVEPSTPSRVVEPSQPGVNEPRQAAQDTSLHLEWIAPPSARLGKTMACQLVVSNTSSTTVQQVTVRLPLAPGVVCKNSEPAAVREGNQLVWSLGALPSTQSRRLELQLVSQSGGPLALPAQVTFTNSCVVQVRQPKLSLKLQMPDKVVAGENVTLNVTASNPGDGVAELIRVKVQLPEGLEHPRGRLIDVDLGNLGARETRTVQLLCMAKLGGVHKCLASAAAEDNLTAADQGQFEVLLPRLELAVVGPKLRYIDRHALYTFKVTNPGTAPAGNVTVHEVMPAGFKFHSATNGGRFNESARTVAWTVGDLHPGQSKEVQLDVVAVAPGEHRHVASVTSGRGLKTDGEVTTRVEGVSSLLVELADADDPVEVGARTAYEVRVTNTGTNPETKVEVIYTLPEQMEFKGAKCAAGCRYRVEGRDVIFEPLPRLAPRADVIYHVHVCGKTAADVRCRVRVRSDSITEPIVREEATRIYNDEMPGQ